MSAEGEPAADGRFERWFVILMAAGLALRLLWALAVPVDPVSDGAAYDQLAGNLAEQGRYVWDDGSWTAFWPVGTAFVYSLLFRLFGHAYWPIVLLNIALGLAILALIMRLGRRWFGAAPALAAGGLYAFWPSQIQFTTVLASELIFNALLLAALWIALEARMRSLVATAVLTGLLLAAAAYVRPQALLLPALIGAFLVWRGRATVTRGVVTAALILATVALCVAPWSMRNTRLFGQFVLISTNGGVVSWMGNNPGSDGLYEEMPADALAIRNEAVRDSLLAKRANAYILADPAGFVGRSIVKLVRTHERESIGITWNGPGLSRLLSPAGVFALKLASNLYWHAVLLLGIAGLVVLARRERWRALIHPAPILWAYFAGVHAITLAQDRYHFPSIPFIAMLAGVTLAALWRRRLRDAGTPADHGRTTAG